jgi:cysteinyl-tRNA synthetase
MLQMRSAAGEIEKMSKSLGNFVTIDDFVAQYPVDVLRLMVLGSPYRAPLVYDAGTIAENERKLERLLGALRPATGSISEGPAVAALSEAIAQARTNFESALDNDFNGPGATAALFEMVKAINTARDAGVGGELLAAAQAAFRDAAGGVGLQLETPQRGGEEAGPFIELLIKTRADLRKAKQFALADQVRNELAALGVILEDSAQGTIWRWGK